MLLRRLSKHVKDQNWFAVSLDFLIVVAGILIAFQITNWGAVRNDNVRAEIYSQRLKAELRAELEYATALLEYNVSTHDAGTVAYRGLTGMAELDNETILINAFRASQYNWYERRRAAFDEIVASGALALIADVGLRETAIGIYNTPIFSIMLNEGQTSRYRDLFRMNIEPDLHDNLASNCGDKEYASKSGAVGLVTLNYPCSLSASQAEIAEGLSALRNDPEILKALRLRNAQVTGRSFDLEVIIKTLGLQKLFLGETS
jgi:hypothetical protein